MKSETIVQNVNLWFELDKHVYNEIFEANGKYDWIAAIRYCMVRRAAKAQNANLEELPEEIKKYDSFFWRTFHRVYVNLNRLKELFE